MEIRRIRRACIYLVLLMLTICLVTGAYSFDPAGAGKEKVSNRLKDVYSKTSKDVRVPVIIFLGGNSTGLKSLNGRGILKTRYSLLNAISADLTADEASALANDPRISRLYYDESIALPTDPEQDNYALYANSDSVGATYARNVLNYTGRNVVVAVVDTGIDYTHPDLGGCFGPGCKVSGGYDFADNDADPMDTNGHGTHCAGIIAAKGGVTGVAPDARLLAVKVCGVSSCSNSALMAGIDWSVAHGADVISLSVGSNKQPNDGYEPLDLMIDAAIERGVVVAAAVGNEGPGAGTIVDTASARKVISVGADDDKATASPLDDAVPEWSCRGPAAFGRIGPDVVAPGVSIYSTKAGGGYVTMEGTSMAAPHVAGAAALLKEYNRSFTPAQIKSLLIHTATNISGKPFERGTGLINVSKAIQSVLEVSMNGADSWEASAIPGTDLSAVLKIKNNGAASLNLSLALEPLTDSEGDYVINDSSIDHPKNVLAGGGEEISLEITLHDTGNIPPGTYGSVLSLDGGGERARIPVSITVPLLGPGTIRGSVDDECAGGSPSNCGMDPSGSVGRWGDWRFYKIENVNGTSLQITLGWSDSGNDLDLYVFAPDGVLANFSGQASTAEGHASIASPSYGEYWIAVYAYNLVQSRLWYNLSVSYASTVSMQPETWQGSAVKGTNLVLNYTLVNDNTADSGIDVRLRTLEYVAGTGFTNSIPYTGNDTFYIVWMKSSSGLNLADASYMNASMGWSDISKDLNLYFTFKDGSTWNMSRFVSKHRNDVLGSAQESLTDIDIRYYLKTFSDIGIGISNPGSPETFNLNLSFTGLKNADSGMATPAHITSLAAGERKAVQASIDTSALGYGGAYTYYLTAEKNGQEIARSPILLTMQNMQATTTTSTTTSSTTSSSSTTTTTPGSCTLTGDNPPCGTIEVAEIINLITAWSRGNASIGDVLALISAWAK